MQQQLTDPRILQVLDVGTGEDQRDYMALELVDGPDLAEGVPEGGMDVNVGFQLMYDTACGLRFAEEKEMLHRDIKPHNLLVCSDGRVKIADWGLAYGEGKSFQKLVGRATVDGKGVVARRIEKSDLAGSAAFMAPEVAGGGAAGAASDVFSLAATWYYVQNGRLPYDLQAADEFEHRYADEGLPQELGCGDPRMEAIYSRMRDANPSNRFGSFAELVAEMEKQFPELCETSPHNRERIVKKGIELTRGRIALATTALVGLLGLVVALSRMNSNDVDPQGNNQTVKKRDLLPGEPIPLDAREGLGLQMKPFGNLQVICFDGYPYAFMFRIMGPDGKMERGTSLARNHGSPDGVQCVTKDGKNIAWRWSLKEDEPEKGIQLPEEKGDSEKSISMTTIGNYVLFVIPGRYYSICDLNGGEDSKTVFPDAASCRQHLEELGIASELDQIEYSQVLLHGDKMDPATGAPNYGSVIEDEDRAGQYLDALDGDLDGVRIPPPITASESASSSNSHIQRWMGNMQAVYGIDDKRKYGKKSKAVGKVTAGEVKRRNRAVKDRMV